MLLLVAFLLAQNIAISGTVKDADRNSLAGVRVAAISVAGNVLVGTTSTDKGGRYTLELPPGEYYVVAGNFWPTYYMASGSRVIFSTPSNGVSFVVAAASVRPPLR